MRLTRWLSGVGVAGAIILVMLTVATDSALTPGALLLAALGVTLTPVALRFPLWASAGYSALFAITVWHAEWRSLIMLLWGAVLLGVVASRRPWYVALIPAVLLTAISAIDPQPQGFALADIATTSFMALLFTLGVVVGALAGDVAAERRALREQAQAQREAIMTMLHDSVAATLTSAVLRSETLALQPSADDAVRDTAAAIADDARRAMGEVRDLLWVMKDDSDAVGSARRPLEDTIEDCAQLLRSHGFACAPSVRLPRSLRSRGLPRELDLVFTEVMANILKYAAPGSVVTLSAAGESRGVAVEIRSASAVRQSDAHMSTGLGLGDIAGRIDSAGGRYSGGAQGTEWVTSVWLPAAVLTRVEDTSAPWRAV